MDNVYRLIYKIGDYSFTMVEAVLLGIVSWFVLGVLGIAAYALAYLWYRQYQALPISEDTGCADPAEQSRLAQYFFIGVIAVTAIRLITLLIAFAPLLILL